MQVTCKICKKKIERDAAYKIIINGKNQYYCSEKEYLDDLEEKQSRFEVFEICKEILGGTTNTLIFKDMTEISSIHSYKKIKGYLLENKDKLNGFMNRNFNGEYGKIKYFMVIVKNNIGDYIQENKIERNIEVETTEVNYKARPRKKSLNQFINEYDEV